MIHFFMFILLDTCDPAIEEHFRRSLRQYYSQDKVLSPKLSPKASLKHSPKASVISATRHHIKRNHLLQQVMMDNQTSTAPPESLVKHRGGNVKPALLNHKELTHLLHGAQNKLPQTPRSICKPVTSSSQPHNISVVKKPIMHVKVEPQPPPPPYRVSTTSTFHVPTVVENLHQSVMSQMRANQKLDHPLLAPTASLPRMVPSRKVSVEEVPSKVVVINYSATTNTSSTGELFFHEKVLLPKHYVNDY